MQDCLLPIAVYWIESSPVPIGASVMMSLPKVILYDIYIYIYMYIKDINKRFNL